MDRGAYALLADAKPPFEQGLRAAGAEQQDVHRGGHDPPDTEAAGGGSVNLAKHALRYEQQRNQQCSWHADGSVLMAFFSI